MNLLMQVLPLMIQLAEALLGPGRGKQKLALTTSLAQTALLKLAENGLVPYSDAHEAGFLQSKIHETVMTMKADGTLDEGKPVIPQAADVPGLVEKRPVHQEKFKFASNEIDPAKEISPTEIDLSKFK